MKKTNYIIPGVIAAAVVVYFMLRKCNKKKCSCEENASSANSTNSNPQVASPLIIQVPAKNNGNRRPVKPAPVKVDEITVTPPDAFAARVLGEETKFFKRDGLYYKHSGLTAVPIDYNEYLYAWKNYKI